MTPLTDMHELVIAGRKKEVEALTKALLDEGHAPDDILYEGLLPGMSVVGDRFEKGEYFIPEMLLAARSLNAGLNILRPFLSDTDESPVGKVLIGTVEGDIHDIGKNLVAVMLQGAGLSVIDAGVDVSADRFIELIEEHSPDLVALSALLTTTMPAISDTVEAITASGHRSSLKIIVGGAPVTQDYADRIGADGYGKNATVAARVAKQLLGVT